MAVIIFEMGLFLSNIFIWDFLWFGCYHDFVDAFLMAADIMVEIKMPFLTKWGCLNVRHKMMAIGLVLVSRLKDVCGFGSDGSDVG